MKAKTKDMTLGRKKSGLNVIMIVGLTYIYLYVGLGWKAVVFVLVYWRFISFSLLAFIAPRDSLCPAVI